MRKLDLLPLVAAFLVLACTSGNESVDAGAPSSGASASLLESSTPADGARLTASPSDLVLNFRSPVRLQEVTVAGSDEQTMPMMITAVGLTRFYSIPLPDLEPGAYSVRWRATDSAGAAQEGRLAFVVL